MSNDSSLEEMLLSRLDSPMGRLDFFIWIGLDLMRRECVFPLSVTFRLSLASTLGGASDVSLLRRRCRRAPRATSDLGETRRSERGAREAGCAPRARN